MTWENEKKFDFDDILIKSEITTDVQSRFNDIVLDGFPLATAPMDTVVDLTNIEKFIDKNIVVVLPRTVSYKEFLDYTKLKNHTRYLNVFVSMGLEEIRDILAGKLRVGFGQNILIDVANGHMSSLHDICDDLLVHRPDINLMVGNIANPETYKIFCQFENVKYVRCGIGNGNGCLTTKSTSIGYPMASLISEIYDIKLQYTTEKRHTPKIIADGGMKDYSDIIKALYLGADLVMIGSIFNKALESCGSNYFMGIKVGRKTAEILYKRGFTIKKYFRGMSTKEAQKAMGKKNLKTSEGVVRYRKVEYTLDGWFENFNHYLRSAMSYCDCQSLKEFIGRKDYVFISTNAYHRFNK